MKKSLFLKIVTLVILNVFIISSSMTSFAAIKEPDVEIQWSYLSECANLFIEVESLEDYDIFGCGGTTTVPLNLYAYVKVELQYLKDGTWKNFATWEDEDYMYAVCDLDVAVTPGYTYRLLLTHKAKNSSGTVLETFNDEADNYLVSLPR